MTDRETATSHASQASISRREYIKWIPGEAAEPTWTLVLTTASRHFIDIRILKPTDPSEPDLPNEGGPLSRLQWAFAGTSHTTSQAPSYPGPKPALEHSGAGRTADGTATAESSADAKRVPHCRWQHWIDSTATGFTDQDIVDEGDMYPQPDGRTLERGEMINPATGENQLYEECWVDEEPLALSQEDRVREVVLVLQQNDEAGRELARGMVIRIGQYVQGLIKVVSKGDGEEKTEVSCERWEYEEHRGWRRTVRIGRLFLPCAVTYEQDVKVGAEIRYGDWLWRVSEA